LVESIGYSTNEYLNLHKVYEKVKNEIKSATETLRAKDNELTQNMGQINQLKDNIENQEKAIKDLNSKLKIYTSRDKANEVLFGEWRIVFHQKENNIILDTLRVVFETDKISKLETTTSSNEIARIIMFDYNPQFNRIKIVLEELKFTGYNFSYLLLTIDNFTFQTQKTKGNSNSSASNCAGNALR
jgi:seryl-tRNA synthetase